MIVQEKELKIPEEFSKDNAATIYHGDCREFLSQVPDKTFQLIITSPPYNIGKKYEERLDPEVYIQQQDEVISECIRTLKDEGSICWQVGNYVDNGEIIPLDILLYQCFANRGLKLRNRIVWHFGHGLHCSRRFSGRYEMVLWFTKSDDYVFNLDAVRVPQKYPGKKYHRGPNAGKYSCNPKGKNPADVWEIPNVKNNHIEKTLHPCQYPISLVQRLILALTNEQDIVFDPFLGVGSASAAALLNNRKAAGAEIVKEYYDIACERAKLAYRGELRYREDKPIYKPNDNLSIAKNPFIKNKEEDNG